MKKSILLTTLLFAVITLSAQNYLPKQIEKIASHHNFNNSNEYIEMQNRNYLIENSMKDSYWTHDSMYCYNGDASEWDLEYRWKYLSSELIGDTSTTSYMRHLWNEANQTWANKDTIVSKNCGMEFWHVEWPWNSQTQEWADTNFFTNWDEDMNTTLFIYKNWDYSTNEFTFGFKDILTYDDNGNMDQKLSYNWDNGEGNWTLYSLYLYTYDEDNLMQTLKQNWDAGLNDWVNQSLLLFTYDENDNIIQQVQQNWDNELIDWVNGGLYINTYDEYDNQTEVFFKYWDSSINEWIKSSLTSNTFNEMQLLTESFNQQWDSEAEEWVDNYLDVSTYDENDQLLLLFSQFWDVESGEWINSSQGTYDYNEVGFTTQNTFQMWDALTNEWVNSWRYDYFWSEHQTGVIGNLQNVKINIYPNPAQDKINIIGDASLQNTSAQIYSAYGKLVKPVMLKSQNEIDISGFQKGVYFIRIQTDKGDFTRKFIKE